MKIIRYVALFLLVSLTAIVLYHGLKNELETVVYEIHSDELSQQVTIVLVTDLHSCDYGQGQVRLIEAIDLVAPDLIVLGGDIVDDVLPRDHAISFFEAVAYKYPCYYVSGNHEFWSGDIEGIKSFITSYGIEVLEGETHIIEVDGQKVSLSGIDDPEVGKDGWIHQLESVEHQVDQDLFSILLTHRPEKVKAYQETQFDLILAGHAHGGQWRIPGILNGLIAPNQGLFPAYAGGLYVWDQQKMIVSRGLAKESTKVPRFFNPLELVVVVLDK